MRTLLIVLALATWSSSAQAQQQPDAPEGTTIQSAHVSGIEVSRLSPGLRHDIEALAGKSLAWTEVGELASRIESERPAYVTAVRAVPTRDGQARVIFFVARRGDDDDNVNKRYAIEAVDIKGVEMARISPMLRDDLQALVGQQVEHGVVDKLDARLRSELPGYDVNRHLKRGDESGKLRLIFEVRKSESLRWIHFAPGTTKYLFHTDEGFTAYMDAHIGDRDLRVSPIVSFINKDDLLEEFSGWGVRVEHRHLGTDRLGAAIELTTFNDTWEDETLAALAVNPQIPEAYRERSTVAPSLTFAFTPHVRVSGGVSITELESLTRTPLSYTANTVNLTLGFGQRWQRDDATDDLSASLGVRTTSEPLGSDLDYTRYLGDVRYRYTWRKNTVVMATAQAGGLTGNAPLFDRFTLGNSETLRGWNKFDVAPAGGDRMFHTSLEFRQHVFALFTDLGSVWDHESQMKVRSSAGVGLHTDNVFLTLAFPLNTDHVTVSAIMGVRF